MSMKPYIPAFIFFESKRKCIELGTKLGLEKDTIQKIIEYVYSLLNNYPSINVDYLVRATYHVYLLKNGVLNKSAREILMNGSTSWFKIIPLVERSISVKR